MPAKKSNPMTQDELKELQDGVGYIALRYVHLGRVLDTLLGQVARLNSLDYPVVVQEEAQVSQASSEQAPAPAEQAPAQEGV